MILITGGSGKLGRVLIEQLPADSFVAPRRHELNLCSVVELRAYIRCNEIKTIIHCAAWTDVESCEIENKRCDRDIVETTQCLVSATQNMNVKWLYISSTGVYGSYQEGAYSEDHRVVPTTYHHKAKLKAETIVQNAFPLSIIVRTGWLFGGDVNDNSDFVIKRLDDAHKLDEMVANNEQIGNPTYVPDLTKQIVQLLKADVSGVFNVVNQPSCSRYIFTKEIIKLAGLTCQINPVSADHFSRIAPVSFNESALTQKLDQECLNLMNSWQHGLHEFVEAIYAQ